MRAPIEGEDGFARGFHNESRFVLEQWHQMHQRVTACQPTEGCGRLQGAEEEARRMAWVVSYEGCAANAVRRMLRGEWVRRLGGECSNPSVGACSRTPSSRSSSRPTNANFAAATLSSSGQNPVAPCLRHCKWPRISHAAARTLGRFDMPLPKQDASVRAVSTAAGSSQRARAVTAPCRYGGRGFHAMTACARDGCVPLTTRCAPP